MSATVGPKLMAALRDDFLTSVGRRRAESFFIRKDYDRFRQYSHWVVERGR